MLSKVSPTTKRAVEIWTVARSRFTQQPEIIVKLISWWNINSTDFFSHIGISMPMTLFHSQAAEWWALLCIWSSLGLWFEWNMIFVSPFVKPDIIILINQIRAYWPLTFSKLYFSKEGISIIIFKIPGFTDVDFYFNAIYDNFSFCLCSCIKCWICNRISVVFKRGSPFILLVLRGKIHYHW